MSELFERYPASADYIRTIARKSNISATTASKLQDQLAKSHQDTIAEVGGDLRQPMGQAYDPATVNANEVARGAIWVACQLERFADAIDVYNESSTDPRSISKLNAAYEELEGEAKLRGFRSLNQEKARLDADLDDAAVEIKRNLDREPKDSEILEAWKNGNLPPAAARAWAHLDLELTDLPADLSDTALTADGMDALTDDRLADALSDPNLNLEVRQAILESSPGAVALLSQRWKLTKDMATRDALVCGPGIEGMIVGPDGRLYNVAIPDGPPETDSDVPVMRPKNDAILDDGPKTKWTTLGSRDGEIAYGKPVDGMMTAAYMVAGLSGGGESAGEWKSIGEDQGAYVRMRDGSATINDGSRAEKDPENPLVGPIPESMTPGPHEAKHLDPNRNPAVPLPERELPKKEFQTKGINAIWVATAMANGVDNAEQAENNRHYATEVTFQETEDGDRRAVINIYQAQSNGEDIRIQQAYGTVDPETGDIVPERSPDE